jgi:hypothetical protein
MTVRVDAPAPGARASDPMIAPAMASPTILRPSAAADRPAAAPMVTVEARWAPVVERIKAHASCLPDVAVRRDDGGRCRRAEATEAIGDEAGR